MSAERWAGARGAGAGARLGAEPISAGFLACMDSCFASCLGAVAGAGAVLRTGPLGSQRTQGTLTSQRWGQELGFCWGRRGGGIASAG